MVAMSFPDFCFLTASWPESQPASGGHWRKVCLSGLCKLQRQGSLLSSGSRLDWLEFRLFSFNVTLSQFSRPQTYAHCSPSSMLGFFSEWTLGSTFPHMTIRRHHEPGGGGGLNNKPLVPFIESLLSNWQTAQLQNVTLQNLKGLTFFPVPAVASFPGLFSETARKPSHFCNLGIFLSSQFSKSAYLVLPVKRVRWPFDLGIAFEHRF